MHYYIDALKKYAEFKGRATRKEFWIFLFINTVIYLLIAYFEGDSTTLSDLYSLFVLVPSLAVGARRMHDSGNSGWFQIIPLANIAWLLAPSDKGDNQYGKDPHAAQEKKSIPND